MSTGTPGPEGPSSTTSHRFRGLTIGAVACAGLVLLGSYVQMSRKPTPRPVAAPTSEQPAVDQPSTAQGRAQLVLAAQATALEHGDEKGWMAAVDPSASNTVALFKQRFATLHGLGASQFDQTLHYGRTQYAPTTPTFSGDVDHGICFSSPVCPTPGVTSSDGSERPTDFEKYTFRLVGGAYLITKVTPEAAWRNGPFPWQDDDLVLAQGSRAVVAAAPSVSGRLREALADADRSAAVADKFATLMNNAQGRYRIFLADDASWKRWFGGETDPHIVGDTYPLENVQSEVVIKVSGNRSASEMATTIQHELGHVVSLGSLDADGGARYEDVDDWVAEGFAEFVAYFPRPATASERRADVHRLMHSARRPQDTLKVTANDSSLQQDELYGYGHFAFDCFARTYGFAKMMTFAIDTMRKGEPVGDAVRDAFGQSEKTVGRTCDAWIARTA